MRTLVMAATMLCAVTHGAHAEASLVAGAGAFNCARFAEDYQKNPEIEGLYLQWALGYLSGLNILAKGAGHITRDLASMTVDAKKAWLRNYCNAHPLASYSSAVGALAGALEVTSDGH